MKVLERLVLAYLRLHVRTSLHLQFADRPQEAAHLHELLNVAQLLLNVGAVAVVRTQN